VLVELSARRSGSAPASSRSLRNVAWPPCVTPTTAMARDAEASGAEEHLALAMALGQLPSGTRLIVHDLNGREWSINPGHPASVSELQGAA
jgi:hypothetical protein